MAARKTNFDLVVLGAGPAGSATAILAAQLGLKVALLERDAFPRHRPGETLHPGIESLLKQLGVDQTLRSAGFLRHQGNWVQWPSELRFEPFGADEHGPWLGFQAWRASFDALLLERARELGVEIQECCQILKPLHEDERVVGVQTKEGRLSAPLTVDAAGGGHWLARKLGLEIRRFSPRLIAHFGYVEGDCPVRNDAPALVAVEAGWTWTARVRPQLYQWTRLTWLAGQKGICAPDELRDLKSHGPSGAVDVTWRMVTDPAGPGYFLVGDAAAVLDPAASHGVLKALMSGMMAAHLSGKVINSEATEQSAALAYRQWLSGWFERDVQQLREMYSRLPNCDWAARDYSD